MRRTVGLSCCYLCRTALSQEGLEVTAFQKLQHDVAGVLLEANAQELNDVGVVELAENTHTHTGTRALTTGLMLDNRTHS